jgi:hypothetical protein
MTAEQGFAAFLGDIQSDPGDGKTLEQVFAPAMRAERPVEAFDGDERMASLLARRYRPGAASDAARKLADAQAQLAAVQEGNDAAVKRQARVQRDHQSGKISVFDIMRMDLAEPDLAEEARLQRRVDALRGQLADTSALVSPQREAPGDPLEETTRRAHRAYVEATRAQLAGDSTPVARRPFAGGDAARSEQVTCPECLAIGADSAESFAIHHMTADGDLLSAPAPDVGTGLPGPAYQGGDAGRYESVARWPVSYDGSGAEVTR